MGLSLSLSTQVKNVLSLSLSTQVKNVLSTQIIEFEFEFATKNFASSRPQSAKKRGFEALFGFFINLSLYSDFH